MVILRCSHFIVTTLLINGENRTISHQLPSSFSCGEELHVLVRLKRYRRVLEDLI